MDQRLAGLPRMPDAIRKALLVFLVSCRGRRLFPAIEDASRLHFVTWPPAAGAAEAETIRGRVSWFLGPLASSTTVSVPVTADRPALRILPLPSIVLLWNARSWRLLSLLMARAVPFLIIDPTLFRSTEEVEWRNLYARYAAPARAAMLRDCSRATFARLADEVGAAPSINLCGNGPHLERIYDHDCRGDATFICNAAVRSDRLLAHLRPKVIAFVNSPYFGPSAFARDHLARVVRCARDFGSFVAIPEGYGHDLLRSHYPEVATRIIGVTLGRTLAVPTADRLVALATANVLTSLMLPLAAALKPRLIRTWGCDGQARSAKGVWTYLPGLEPRLDSVASEHPAFVEGLQKSDDYWTRTYSAHADHLEQLLGLVEEHGIRVVCASPSAIPALARRRDATEHR